MATSVQLKACGGIPPYTWETTGGLLLSNTSGVHTTVSVGPEQNNFPNEVATIDWYVSVSIQAGACVQTSGNDRWVTYECDGDAIAGGDNFKPYLVHSPGTFEVTTTIRYTDCSNNPQQTTEEGSWSGLNIKGGTSIFVTDSVNWVERGVTRSTSEVEFSASGEQLMQSGVDFRSQDMLDEGCTECDDTGTVTVTDSMGISTTYVFS